MEDSWTGKKAGYTWDDPPLDITFDSEDRFYFYYDTSRVLYTVKLLEGTHTILRSRTEGSDGPVRRRRYCVDEGCEWVISGSQRICWIPPGYIGSTEASHCWAGFSLVMAGQDGTLRKLTFRRSSP